MATQSVGCSAVVKHNATAFSLPLSSQDRDGFPPKAVRSACATNSLSCSVTSEGAMPRAASIGMTLYCCISAMAALKYA